MATSSLTHWRTTFRTFRDDYARTMERMFAAVSDLYGDWWNDFFHFAIFDEPDLSWEEAFARTHRRYMQAVGVPRARRVLELACGRGAFTHLMATCTEGEVVGVDISGAQLSRARRFRRPNLRFVKHDIMRIHEIDERFDAAVYLDAACYLPDKALALERIARVLVPGARLLLVDWCKAERLTQLQEELVLYPFMHDWAISSLETRERYERHFRAAGFRIVEVDDLNDRIGPNCQRSYDHALRAVQELKESDAARLAWKGMKLGPEGARMMKDQFNAALYIKAGFDLGFLRYVAFTVERA